MKLRHHKLLSAALILPAFVMSYALLTDSASAQDASLYLDPASATVSEGDTFDVDVRVDTDGEDVNAAEAQLLYSASDLSFVEIDSSSSAFEVEASESGGSGEVTISRGTTTPQSGDLLLSTVTFEAVAGGVTTDITFDEADSAVVRESDNQDILTSTTGGSYTLESTGDGGDGSEEEEDTGEETTEEEEDTTMLAQTGPDDMHTAGEYRQDNDSDSWLVLGLLGLGGSAALYAIGIPLYRRFQL